MTIRRLLDEVLFNIEERGWWVSGRLRADPSLFVEFSFEDALQIPKRYWVEPSAPVIYFGLHGPKHTVAEFMLGQWVRRPLDPDQIRHIARVVLPLCHYQPRFIDPAVDPSFYARLIRTSSYVL